MRVVPPSGYLSVTGAAARAGVSTRTIQRWCDEHGLPYTRVEPIFLDSPRLIAIADLDAFEQPRAPGPVLTDEQRVRAVQTRHRNRLTKCQTGEKAKSRHKAIPESDVKRD